MLTDLEVEDLTFEGQTSDGFWIISTVVLLSNNGSAEAEIGDLSLELLYKDVHLGSVQAKNVSIQPGVNELQLRGVIDPSESSLHLLSEFFSSYIQGQKSMLTVRLTEAKVIGDKSDVKELEAKAESECSQQSKQLLMYHS